MNAGSAPVRSLPNGHAQDEYEAPMATKRCRLVGDESDDDVTPYVEYVDPPTNHMDTAPENSSIVQSPGTAFWMQCRKQLQDKVTSKAVNLLPTMPTQISGCSSTA
ncbi:hypothetical protein H257_08043 [Aphanomyces astaci]|uniref:Uncharacterized protein n=1 Tax=Aphanomyces astaci TaxID=112090 RepID=W4GFT1_APHAT|nr:hypothetical protein H257_08043 [Aphanomyces astaci]ETV78530.1 hypothetical protein H257_08043 [Aphanomyces astaci]|eukprot:XP_009832111.1 hypothetical protein H257_08043 [Aphanomyces astaci]